MTTVGIPRETICKAAVEMLMAIAIKGRGRRVEAATYLVVRNSTSVLAVRKSR